MSGLAGGTDPFGKLVKASLTNEDYQWAFEIADYGKWIRGADRRLARQVKIRALRGLAVRKISAPNWNDYLSYASELEAG